MPRPERRCDASTCEKPARLRLTNGLYRQPIILRREAMAEMRRGGFATLCGEHFALAATNGRVVGSNRGHDPSRKGSGSHG